MKGMKLKEFAESVSWGMEVEFNYHDMTYFVQGWGEGELYRLVVDHWKTSNNQEVQSDYLLDVVYPTQKECADAFFCAKIFEGKTFYEIEKDVTVTFG